MRTINEIRADIDNIDKELKDSFIKRMNLIKEMKEYKLSNNLPILDSNRELEIISKISDSEFKEEVIDFTKNLLNLSKSYMSK